MDIKGNVFIVTRGASGLGEGTARMLIDNGGQVLIADIEKVPNKNNIFRAASQVSRYLRRWHEGCRNTVMNIKKE